MCLKLLFFSFFYNTEKLSSICDVVENLSKLFTVFIRKLILYILQIVQVCKDLSNRNENHIIILR